jgi:hypothetical protein
MLPSGHSPFHAVLLSFKNGQWVLKVERPTFKTEGTPLKGMSSPFSGKPYDLKTEA